MQSKFGHVQVVVLSMNFLTLPLFLSAIAVLIIKNRWAALQAWIFVSWPRRYIRFDSFFNTSYKSKLCFFKVKKHTFLSLYLHYVFVFVSVSDTYFNYAF